MTRCNLTGLRAATFAMILTVSSLGAIAQTSNIVEVWKSPYCGCCSKWVDHLKAAGFHARVNDLEDMNHLKDAHQIPPRMRSCHTAKVGGYIVEGHVPAADIKRLLQNRPRIVGISVPAMPLGSPGMEMPSGEKQAYNVLSFDRSGKTKVFAQHE